MKFFKSKRFVWNEPWFFQQRIRSKRVWFRFSLILLFFWIVGYYALYNAAPAINFITHLKYIGMSFGLPFAAWWVLDGTNTRRPAILYEDSLVVGGDMGKYSYPTIYELSKILDAWIIFPEQAAWPAAALIFIYEGEEQSIGIEQKVNKIKLAQALHDVGVLVQMDDWEPSQDNKIEKEFSWESEPGQLITEAQIEILPSGTVSFMTFEGMALGIIRQCWALTLWLLIAGASIYYTYQNWNNLEFIHEFILVAISLGTLNIALQFNGRYASASMSAGLTRMMIKQIRKREGIQIDINNEDLIPVEIFTRDQFDKKIQKMREMGFLQPDIPGQRMLFEGKKERWSIPISSIKSLSIDEVQTGTPGQSALGALEYYVVVKFLTDEEKEFGFRYAKREYGLPDDYIRAKGGFLVYVAFKSILGLT
jgi:hypothetical protein